MGTAACGGFKGGGRSREASRRRPMRTGTQPGVVPKPRWTPPPPGQQQRAVQDSTGQPRKDARGTAVSG